MRRGKRAGEAASVSSPFLQVLETQRAGPAEYQVVQHLDQLIRERVLSPGDKLPSEIGLAKELNVPRSAVASIYTKLAMFGLVEARPQSGTYLASMSGFAFEGFLKEVMKLASQDMEVEDLRYLYELRQLHEKFVARLAAEKITPAQVEELRAVARDVKERVLSGGESIEADLLFHLKIAAIVHDSEHDFRGDLIRVHEEEGFQYASEITLWTDPVIEQRKTNNMRLLYKQLRKDSTFSEAEYGFRSFGELLHHLANRGVLSLSPGPATGDPEIPVAEGGGSTMMRLVRRTFTTGPSPRDWRTDGQPPRCRRRSPRPVRRRVAA